MVEEISSLCNTHDLAWDAGTGNGQLAALLSPLFKKVEASDISEKQLAGAIQKQNIHYFISDSTSTRLKEDSVDLVTVAQAIHWFDFEKFYAEVNRVLKKDGVIALIGYGLMRSHPKVNAIIEDLYYNILGSYWDAERKMVDESYANIPFPFHEIMIDSYSIPYTWNVDQLVGFFSTWSALQHYRKKNNHDLLPMLHKRFAETGFNEFEIDFPLFARVGRK